MDGYASRTWTFLQRQLFPMLQEELGPLTQGERRLAAAAHEVRVRLGQT